MKIDVKIKWRYEGKEGTCVDTWGYPGFNPYEKENIGSLLFWYEEGNGSCDCNRSVICGLSNEPWPCGDKIEFLSINPILPDRKERVIL